MLDFINRFLLSLASPEALKFVGLWMIIAGLVAEAAVIIAVPSGGLEKTLSVLFTLLIAAGVWIEHVGTAALEAVQQKEAALSQEQLRKQIGPRRIDSETFLKALEGKPKAPAEIMFSREDGEAFQLAIQIRNLLREAGWVVTET